jgi:mono/diheme cytochrome c family protein
MNRICLSASLMTLTLVGLAQAAAPKPEPALARQALGVLKTRCLSCHGAEAKGGLDLRSRAAALKGGKRGAALVTGKSGESLMVHLMNGTAQPAMPLGSPLPREELALLERWIAQGAPWPAAGIKVADEKPAQHWAFVPVRKPAVPKVKNATWVRNPIDAFVLADLERKGLQPSPEADRRTLLRRVTVDLTGLQPTPDEIAAFLADRSPTAYEKVVARLLASPNYGERWGQHWLDVVRFADTNGFELDADRPQAWRYRDYVVRALNQDVPYNRFLTEQVAGDLLADGMSKGGGETKQGATLTPFDLRVATGFLRAGPAHVVGGNVDAAVARQEWLTEAVGGVGSALLGITIGCARCHDHKFDPLPQKDYYRLQAFFAGTDNSDLQPPDPERQKAIDAALQAIQAQVKPLQAQISVIEQPYRERLRAEKTKMLDAPTQAALAIDPKQRTPAQQRLLAGIEASLRVTWDDILPALNPADRERRAALRQQMHALELTAPQPLPLAPGVEEKLKPTPPVHVLVRGEVHAKGDEVQPSPPGVLLASQVHPAAPSAEAPAARRLELAQWLTQPDNPLTARVMMNRLWQHHFGAGIVGTPNDFGKHGQRPTHPALLDWMAATFSGVSSSEFQVSGVPATKNIASLSPTPWSLKRMHLLMVTSSTYRQASQPDARKAKVDPENRLLWRANRQRLDAEALRDSILQAAGTLNRTMGGPPVRVPLEPEVYATIFSESEPDNLWPVTPDVREHRRRSLYLLHKRNVRLPMLAVFDQPDMMSSCAARGQTVHALQSLTLTNSDFMRGQSAAFATRLVNDCRGDRPRMIERLFLLTQGRSPRPEERRATEGFLHDQSGIIRERIARGEPVARLAETQGKLDAAEAAAWVDLCLAAFNLNDFVYLR